MLSSIRKEKKLVKLFTGLIIAGIALLVASVVLYIVIFADAVKHFTPIADQFRNEAELEAAIAAYVQGGVTGSVYLGMAGVALIIVFSILRKKKKNLINRAIYQSYKERTQQEEVQPQQ